MKCSNTASVVLKDRVSLPNVCFMLLLRFERLIYSNTTVSTLGLVKIGIITA